MTTEVMYFGFTRNQLMDLTGQTYGTIRSQLARGSCQWPRKAAPGATLDPAYPCWSMMIQRCTNSNFPKYPEYGGRGIKIAAGWLSFWTFRRDVGPRPSPQHSLDRIDTNGNYEPGNVRWATSQQQATNRRPRRWKRKPNGNKSTSTLPIFKSEGDPKGNPPGSQ